jgi:hypothetical protein
MTLSKPSLDCLCGALVCHLGNRPTHQIHAASGEPSILSLYTGSEFGWPEIVPPDSPSRKSFAGRSPVDFEGKPAKRIGPSVNLKRCAPSPAEKILKIPVNRGTSPRAAIYQWQHVIQFLNRVDESKGRLETVLRRNLVPLSALLATLDNFCKGDFHCRTQAEYSYGFSWRAGRCACV